MELYSGNIYHIYNRGNNRQRIFFERQNYTFFLKKMRTHLLKHCDILAWCLMNNHFHWMIKVHDDYPALILIEESDNIPPLNRSISTLLSSYSKAINKMYNRTGSLFQQRTHAVNLNSIESSDDYYPLICFNYIHQNPLKASIVNKLEDYEFSSFNDYARMRKGKLCNKTLARDLLDLPGSRNEFLDLSYKMIPDHISRNIF